MKTTIKKTLCLSLILALSAPISGADNWKTWLTGKTAAIATGTLATAGGLALLYKYLTKETPEQMLDAALADLERIEAMPDEVLKELEERERAAAASIFLYVALLPSINAAQERTQEEEYQNYIRKIESKKNLCLEYVGPLPKHIYALACKAAQDIGVSDVHFYLTRFKSAHAKASSGGLQLMGITNNDIDPLLYIVRGRRWTEWFHELHRTLYHELCHIKNKHITLTGSPFTPYPSKDIKLSYEMEAELGARYYLNRIKKFRLNENECSYEDDGEHPTTEEHKRYIAELLRRMDNNPALSYDVVKELAEIYLQEKRSGVKVHFANAQNTALPASSSSCC